MGPRRRQANFRLTIERKVLLKHLVRYRYLRTSHLHARLGTGDAVTDQTPLEAGCRSPRNAAARMPDRMDS